MKMLTLVFLFVCGIASAQQKEYAFPLAIAKDNRHLVDQRGKYFLYNGDTAWMLFLKLTREEALEYLVKRKAQGFNVIQIILTGFADFNKETPINRYGQRPFLKGNDFNTTNPAYFEYVEWVVKRADSLGLALSIAPLWAGCCSEGWAGKDKAMAANKPEGNFKFGEFLGKRFAKYKNMLWILGGDNDPHTDKNNYRQLALGIKKYAPRQLITYHASSSHSSTDVWEGEPWLDFSMVYTYFRGFNKAWNPNQPDVYEVAWKEYAKRPLKPFILGESTYEGEHDSWGSAVQARKQAYWAVLGGGVGNAYGSPVWKCEANWRDYMDLPGAVSLRQFHRFFSALKWEKLVPDTNKHIAVSGNGDFASNNYSTTAIANDGSFSVSYLPSPITLEIDLGKYMRGSLVATWFNPISGLKGKAEKIDKRGLKMFSPPAGQHDWVLLVQVR
ncbi:apiosidase-like domain-containing protein [Pedobacter psychroterrae]|uniref:DUF4038 domain-containing protein n=1 Tax=Pedobacter psychroterrae TaxID=2530453 RepID=A0A4R0NKR5_9SPHI|nr:DUF4038 domain-containing protein [Pedobacter psychroterrae]TCD01362.1 DUF4038 domain-containing protein [Pedobacter psychroterrae]